ncbi:MAG: O-antigen ligase family protein [Novosphingobium sp.]
MSLPLRQWATIGFLLLALLLGGASAAGYTSNLILQFAGVMLIAYAIWSSERTGDQVTGLGRFLVGLVALFLLQAIPLPPALWELMPGRDAVAKGYDLAGMTKPWLAYSLDPWGSLQSFVWWLPAFAIFLALRAKQAPPTRAVIWLIAAVAYVSVILAATQAFGGSGYFYTITNRGNGVGLFANSNHFSSFMLIAMALLAGQSLHDRPVGHHGKHRLTSDYVLAAQLTPLAFGVLLSDSLAGQLLMIPVLGGIALLSRPAWKLHWPLVAATLVAFSIGLVWLLSSGLAANDLLAKSGTAGISRGEFLTNGIRMLQDFAPFGSGIGTFREIYPWYEDLSKVGTTYANHAHNDLLELLIETGLFGLIVLTMFLVWLVKRSWQLWNSNRSENLVALSASIAIWAVLLHSLVDYPLRTAAVSCLVALCCVLISRTAEARGVSALPDSGSGKRETMIEI